MAGAIWGDGFMPTPDHQLMNPSIWGPGDPSGPPPNPAAAHWGLPPGHPPPGAHPPPPQAAFQPSAGPSSFPGGHPGHGGFPGAKSPWEAGASAAPVGWGHPQPTHAPPNGWGGPPTGGPPWQQQPPQPNVHGHSSHGHGGRGGGHGGALHAQPPPSSAPPHAPQPGSNSFQWSNPPSFVNPSASNAGKSFAETVQGPGVGPPRGLGPGGPRGGPPFDGWGSGPPGVPVGKVNQGVPWDVANPDPGVKEWDMKGTGHWGDPSGGQGQPSSHHPSGWGAGNPGQPGGGRGDWQQQQQQQQPDNNGTGLWNQGGGGGGHGGNWGGGGGGGHQGHHGGHGGRGGGGGGGNWDHGHPPSAPQPNAPHNDNMWVPPGPMETNNDMIWHDPNPKTKKPIIDKGTSAWGDPGDSKWGDIKRWKEGNEDVVSSSAWAGSPLAPTPGGSSPTTSGGPPAPVAKSVSTPGTGVPSGWGEPPTSRAPDWAGPTPVGWDGPKDPAAEGEKAAPKELPDWQGGLEPSSGNLRDLTAQIAGQLRVAVSKGLINMSILNQPLPQNVLLVLNNLLQRVPKLESATAELTALKASPSASSPSQLQEIARLEGLVAKLKGEIHELQSKINRSTPGDKDGDGPGGMSKLNLWKTDADKKMGGAASTPDLGQLAEGVDKLGLGDVWGTNTVAGDLWAAEKHNGESRSEGGGSKKGSGDNSSSATPTPGDSLPKEFVPGKKWEWDDPNKRALDPNATPGSLKPNPMSVGSGLASSGSVTPTKMDRAGMSPSGIWGGPPVSGPGRFNRSVSSPVQVGASAFAPYNGPAVSCLVLAQTGGVPEGQLREACAKSGNLVHFLAHAGHQIAIAKFAENLAAETRIPARIQGELAPFGVSVTPADDAKVQSIFSAMSSGGRPAQQAPAPWGAPPFAGGPESGEPF